MSSNNESHSGPGGSEAINTEIITLTRFLTEEQTKHKEATGDFTYVERVNRVTILG
jgi:fructose-1,6-bisphosphatase I